MGMGERLAGDCHVFDTNMQVIRYVRSKMHRVGRINPTLRNMRKEVYRDALAAHARNRELFYSLAKGDLG